MSAPPAIARAIFKREQEAAKERMVAAHASRGTVPQLSKGKARDKAAAKVVDGDLADALQSGELDPADHVEALERWGLEGEDSDQAPETLLERLWALLAASWRSRAACAGSEDPDLWFSEATSTIRARQRREVAEHGRVLTVSVSEARAKAVCARCPVRRECLEANLHDEWGIWGGTLPVERRPAVARNGSDEAAVEDLLEAMDRQALLLGLVRSEGAA